jgi:hypothetical protein
MSENVRMREYELAAVGTEPPPPPPDPEPTPVDWAALMALVDEALVVLVGVVGGLARAGDLLQSLRNRIEEYELAAEGGEE